MAIKHFVNPSLGPRQMGLITTVEPATRKIEAKLKDGGEIAVSLFDIPPFFVWPKVGDLWIIRKDGGYWKLDTKIDTDKEYPVDNLNAGEGKISADIIKTPSGKNVVVVDKTNGTNGQVVQYKDGAWILGEVVTSGGSSTDIQATVAGSAAGTDPTVTKRVVGTTTYFDFTIPSGATGAQGNPGAVQTVTTSSGSGITIGGTGANPTVSIDTTKVATYSGSTLASGITSSSLTKIGTLSSGAGTAFVKTDGSGNLTTDSNTYLTGNQTITMSGDVSGSGTTSITNMAIGSGKVTDSMINAGITTGNASPTSGAASSLLVSAGNALGSTITSTNPVIDKSYLNNTIASTVDISTAAISTGTKIVNIGTNSAAGSTTNINIGSQAGTAGLNIYSGATTAAMSFGVYGSTPLISFGTSALITDINMNSHKVTNVTDPTSAQDATTKNYVDYNGRLNFSTTGYTAKASIVCVQQRPEIVQGVTNISLSTAGYTYYVKFIPSTSITVTAGSSTVKVYNTLSSNSTFNGKIRFYDSSGNYLLNSGLTTVVETSTITLSGGAGLKTGTFGGGMTGTASLTAGTVYWAGIWVPTTATGTAPVLSDSSYLQNQAWYGTGLTLANADYYVSTSTSTGNPPATITGASATQGPFILITP
jgi:hypothetical protein